MKGPRHAILDESGNVVECDLITWAMWFEKSRQRIIEQDQIGDLWVSTIFIGLNHQYGRGPPLWFETMVFHEPEYEPGLDRMIRPEAGYCERYTTIQEARAGHAAAIEWIRAKKAEQGSRYDSRAVLGLLKKKSRL
ncbi:MAG TPA: hypothetical protein VHS80_13910 [Chthoniobacterales bacterium]|jgi:hypothetical protein|nr:hypothetical protein [Chthoniobacterales bacterium]